MPRNHILLRSSWQFENIGDIAHTPGMLALLEKHRPNDRITLWPMGVNEQIVRILHLRFPRLRIVHTPEQAEKALESCDFFLHGSGPGLVGKHEARRARQLGKPYGFAGITLSDDEIEKHRDLLVDAKFVFLRDTDSLKALNAAGVKGSLVDFGPDATFALNLRNDRAASALLRKHRLKAGEFLCAIPRLRWTPYWEIRPQQVPPNPVRSAENEAFADRDHAKLREAIVAWVRHTGRRVFLVPEMTYEVPRLRPLLFDPLPDEVKPAVEVLDRYWWTDEAASVYAKAACIVSFEQHSPIMAIASGVPAVLLRTPTDTRKGQMWRDIGLHDWIFEIDETSGKQISRRLLQIVDDLKAARAKAKKARAYADQRMARMIRAIG